MNTAVDSDKEPLRRESNCVDFGVRWTRTIVNEFIEEALLNDEEQKLLRMKAAGWSRVKQGQELNVSLATVDRLNKGLKAKYDAAQKHSDILPPRIQKS